MKLAKEHFRVAGSQASDGVEPLDLILPERQLPKRLIFLAILYLGSTI